jgi:hypothetical protein
MQSSYDKGYHYYSEWEREATVLRYEWWCNTYRM